MRLIDYIDYWEIYRKIKKSQLEQFPTAQEYIEELKDLDEPYDYVEEMYKAFKIDFSGFDGVDSENFPNDCIGNIFSFEFSTGGGESYENGGDNFWGYGYNFEINLDEERFVNFWFENYC